jgi:flagellar hook protein FlgE
MSFQTGLSGLSTASRNLDVIGNNIANANTIGMKSSRAEFADLVASSLGSGATGGAGIGVTLANVSQQFSQGNINITGNNLDAAINGGGFFELKMPDGTAAYTRDGQFKLDKLGNIVTNSGANVMGYPTSTKGVPTSTTIQALQLPTSAPIAANQTTTITTEFNLDARAPLAAGSAAVVGPPAIAAVPATPRTTYGTSLTAFDSQGTPVPVSLYFEHTSSTAAGDVWSAFDTSANTGTAAAPIPAAVFSMTFDANGKLTSPTTSPTLSINTPSVVTPNISATLDVSKVTQFGAAFAVSNITQDGYAPGELTSLKIGSSGVITASYSNGQTQSAGQLALADFRNVQGLTPTGGGNWVETFASGQPVQGSPGVGKFGALTAGALEESNVDLTAELVNMMTAQRAYQANAQTIKTQDQVMTTLVNLR